MPRGTASWGWAMIAEAICHIMGWPDAWYAHPGTLGLWPASRLRFSAQMLVDGRWHVGVWTGREGDLLCVKRCRTNREANRCLSPGAPTLALASLLALMKCAKVVLYGSSVAGPT
jgi:hypothetical protein